MTNYSSPEEIQNLINTTNRNIDTIKSRINRTRRNIANQQMSIKEMDVELNNKNNQIFGQSSQIENKKKLINTRNMMLQLSLDRNIYKKKVIYSLLAFIIAILALMIFGYVFFNKKKNL